MPTYSRVEYFNYDNNKKTAKIRQVKNNGNVTIWIWDCRLKDVGKNKPCKWLEVFHKKLPQMNRTEMVEFGRKILRSKLWNIISI